MKWDVRLLCVVWAWEGEVGGLDACGCALSISSMLHVKDTVCVFVQQPGIVYWQSSFSFFSMDTKLCAFQRCAVDSVTGYATMLQRNSMRFSAAWGQKRQKKKELRQSTGLCLHSARKVKRFGSHSSIQIRDFKRTASPGWLCSVIQGSTVAFCLWNINVSESKLGWGKLSRASSVGASPVARQRQCLLARWYSEDGMVGSLLTESNTWMLWFGKFSPMVVNGTWCIDTDRHPRAGLVFACVWVSVILSSVVTGWIKRCECKVQLSVNLLCGCVDYKCCQSYNIKNRTCFKI